MSWFPLRLVKYCKREHNPLYGATHLQIGTLDYYRGMDASFSSVGDSEEASYTVSLQPGATYQLDDHLCKRLWGDSMKISGDFTVLPTGTASAKWLVANAFIFSCSELQDNELPSIEAAREVHPDYDSYYCIEDQEQFARLVLERLNWHTYESLFSDRAWTQIRRTPITRSMEFRISPMGARVQYADGNKITFTPDTVKYAPDHTELLHRALFTKLRQYETQREFRFAWVIEGSSQGPLPVKKDPILIPLRPFDDVLRSTFEAPMQTPQSDET